MLEHSTLLAQSTDSVAHYVDIVLLTDGRLEIICSKVDGDYYVDYTVREVRDEVLDPEVAIVNLELSYGWEQVKRAASLAVATIGAGVGFREVVRGIQTGQLNKQRLTASALVLAGGFVVSKFFEQNANDFDTWASMLNDRLKGSSRI